MRVCSTHDDMQYPWGKFHSFFIHINSLTSAAYPHGYWGYHLQVLRIWLTVTVYPHSTEDMTHEYCISSRVLRIWLTGTNDMAHRYCIFSWVLRIWLKGTEDMTHGYCTPSQVLRILLTGTAHSHRYWWYDSRVLRIWLTGTAHPHRYWGYDSQVLMIWLTGNAYSHGYCIPSPVLHIVYTGWAKSVEIIIILGKQLYFTPEMLIPCKGTILLLPLST